MPKKRFYSGAIRFATLIGVLFLFSTLTLSVYIASNKEFRLNIGSRAKAIIEGVDIRDPELQKQIKEVRQKQEERAEDEERQEKSESTATTTTQQEVKTCNVDGTSYSEGSVAVYGGQTDLKKCNNGSWVDCPTCNIAQLTTVPTYLQDEYNKALQDVAQRLEKEEMSISGTDVIQEQKKQIITEIGSQIIQKQAGQTDTIPVGRSICAGDDRQIWNGDSWDTTKCSGGCNSGACISTETFVDGGPGGETVYTTQTTYDFGLGRTQTVTSDPYTVDTFTNLPETENGKRIAVNTNPNITTSITNITRDWNTKDIIDIQTTPLTYTSSVAVQKTDEGFVRSLNTVIRNNDTNEIFDLITQDITTNTTQQPLFSVSKNEYKYGSGLDISYSPPTYAFADCHREGLTPEQSASCDKSLSQAYSFPIVGRYIQAYAPQNVTYTGEDLFGYNLYNPTGEQFASSVALGTTLTAAGAIITSPFAWVAGSLTGAQAISLGFASMTTLQTGTAVDICTINPGSPECYYNAGMALVSWTNIASSANLARAIQTGKGVQTASTINTAINVGNVGVDAVDIALSCGSGQFASTANCAGAWLGTVFDVGQAGVDLGILDAIAKNLDFSGITTNPLNEVNHNIFPALDTPVSNIPRGINPNNVVDVVQGPNGNFVVPNTSTTALAVAPHLNIAQADDVITATILDGIPATRPQDSPQEIAGLLMAPEQPINVTNEFAGLTPKVEVEVGGDKLSIPQPENKGFTGMFDEILNPPLAAFNPNLRWLMNLEPPKFIANIGDWVNRNIGNNPIINRIIGKPEDISLSLRPDEAGIYDSTLSRTLNDEQFFDVTDEFNALRKDNYVDVSSNQPFDEELTASIDEMLTPIRERREIIEDIKQINLTPKQIINAYGSGDINEILRISNLLRDNKLDPKAVYKAVIDEYTYLLGVRQADIKANFLEYKNVSQSVKDKLVLIINDQYGIDTQGYSMDQIADLRNKYLDIRAELELDGTEVQSPITANMVNEIVEPTQFQRNTTSPTGFWDKARTQWENTVDGLGNLLNPLATRLGLDIQVENLRFTDQAIEGRLSDQAINDRRLPPEWVQRIISSDDDWFPISLLPETSPYRVLINEVVDQIVDSAKVDYNLGYDDITKSPLFTRPQYPTELGVIKNQNNVVFENNLAIKGASITPEMLKKEIDDICRLYPDACSSNLLSPTYHGSSSTGLFGLLTNDQTPIKPLSELTDHGGYVFSQSMRNGFLDTGTTSRSGPTGIISVTAIDPLPAKSYARGVEFDPASARQYLAEIKGEYETFFDTTINRIRSLDIPLEEQNIIIDYLIATKSYDLNNLENVADRVQDILKKYESTSKIELIKTVVLDAKAGLTYRDRHLRTIDLIERQINAYPNLSDWQRDLLDNSFPVMFGIKPDNGRQPIMMISSTVDNEMGFVGGFKMSEIQTVFVPKSQISKIIDLWINLNPGVDIPFKIEDIGVFDTKTDIEISPIPGFLNGVKNWWDESFLNWRNWGFGNAQMKDPVADIDLEEIIRKSNPDNSQITTVLPQYEPGSATKHYVIPENIKIAIENTPDPLEIIRTTKEAKSVDEALTNIINVLEANGINIVRNPLELKYANTLISISDAAKFRRPINDPDTFIALYVPQGRKIHTTPDGSVYTFIPEGVSVKNYIFLHPDFETLPKNKQVVILQHEAGHFIEDNFLSNIVNVTIDNVTVKVRPSTEYISSLYGSNAAISPSIRLLDTKQIELNSIVAGNPKGYLKIPSPTGFWDEVKNWWDELKQSNNKIIQLFTNPSERGSLGIPLPYTPNDIDIKFNENAFVDSSGIRTAKGFLDNEGNLNFGIQPSFTNIEYYPVTIRRIGSEYQILPTFDIGRNFQGDNFYDATISSNHGQILLQLDGTMKYSDTGSLNGSFYRNPTDDEFIRINLGEEVFVTKNTEIRLGGNDGNIIRVNNNTNTGKIEIVNTTTKKYASYNKPPVSDVSKINTDDVKTKQMDSGSNDTLPKQIDTPDPTYYRFDGENKLVSTKNGGKYRVFITENLAIGGEGKIELGAIENTQTGNNIEVIIKHALSPEDGQKMVNQYRLFDKIENILIAEGRPDLKSRIVIPLGIVQDINGNPTAYIRSYASGKPIWEGHGKVNGKMTDADIREFEDLFRILDKYGISPYDISPQNFIGSPGKYVLTDITPEENVKLRKDGTPQQVGHFIDTQIVNTGYIQRRLRDGDEIIPDPTSGKFFYDTHASNSALENFKLMVKYQDEGFVRPIIKPQGQTLVEFSTVMPVIFAVPTVGLYYLDQYLDLGIFDYIINSINDSLDIDQTKKKLGAIIDSSPLSIVDKGSESNTTIDVNFSLPEIFNIDSEIEPILDNTLTITPPEGLTKYGDGECTRSSANEYCDGTRMFELYEWYTKQTDAWWNENGQITPAEFLALMLVSEATGGDPELLKAITIATANQIWGSSDKHEPYCKTPSCEEGIFNFLGDYVQSAGERYNGLISNDGNPSQGTIDNLLRGQEVAKYFESNGLSLEQIANDLIYNPISTTYGNDSPTQWGVTGCGENCEGIEIEWLKNLNSQSGVKYGTTDRCGIFDVYGQDGVIAVVFTNNQAYNWSLPKEESPCY